jgi:hypothetical protein
MSVMPKEILQTEDVLAFPLPGLSNTPHKVAVHQVSISSMCF